MECWLREKEKPAKENAGKGGGNEKTSIGECWWSRMEWNAEWDRRKGQQRSLMLVREEGMECWKREKERPAKENAGKGGGNGMLNETEGKASKRECWQGRREWNAE
jgi:hypothetical protein